MGNFRILSCDLPCVRCGAIQSQGVQFKTDDDDDIFQYQEGQVELEIPAGEYNAIGAILCYACVNEWLELQRLACLDAVSQMVRDEEVAIDHFALVHLDSVAPRKTELWPNGPIRCPVVTVAKYFGFAFETFRLLQERTAERLTDQGWPADRVQDMTVCVDALHRITLVRW